MNSQHEELGQLVDASAGQAAHTVEKYRDIHSVGRLAEMLRDRDRAVVFQAEEALTVLLPQLQASDADLLNTVQRECLYSLMQIRNISGKSHFLVAALNALARIDDVRALPTVAALASCQVDSSSGRRVKTAAESCLQTLSEVEALEDPQKSLLRASEAALGSTDTLLRPVKADSGSPDTMVRPATGQTDDRPEELLRVDTSDVQR